MKNAKRWTMLNAVALALLTPASGMAQLEVTGRAASVRVGGLVQPQYTVSSVEAADNDAFVRRARLRADATVNDFLTGRVVTEFGSGGGGAVLDADLSLHFSEAFVLSFGQFKRAFDIFELPNPSDPPEIERDGRIAGFAPGCAGVGRLCAYSRFTEALQFAARDQGFRVDGTVGRLTYLATVTNGTGLNERDDNDRKSASGRITYTLSNGLQVSGQLALHDYMDSATALGLGGDVEWGTWRDGLHVRAAVVAGDNWMNLDPTDLDPSTFLTFQGIATYYVPIESTRFVGVEPFGRLSYGDPDTATDEDGGVLITPGVALYIFGRDRISANFDYYKGQGLHAESSFKLQSTLYF